MVVNNHLSKFGPVDQSNGAYASLFKERNKIIGSLRFGWRFHEIPTDFFLCSRYVHSRYYAPHTLAIH